MEKNYLLRSVLEVILKSTVIGNNVKHGLVCFAHWTLHKESRVTGPFTAATSTEQTDPTRKNLLKKLCLILY